MTSHSAVGDEMGESRYRLGRPSHSLWSKAPLGCRERIPLILERLVLNDVHEVRANWAWRRHSFRVLLHCAMQWLFGVVYHTFQTSRALHHSAVKEDRARNGIAPHWSCRIRCDQIPKNAITLTASWMELCGLLPLPQAQRPQYGRHPRTVERGCH